MTPVSFPEQNIVFAEDQPQYQPLPAYRTEEGEVVSCWELSDEEFQELLITRRVWLRQMTFGKPMQPILPQIEKPFQ